jgi:hypothetical protein
MYWLYHFSSSISLVINEHCVSTCICVSFEMHCCLSEECGFSVASNFCINKNMNLRLCLSAPPQFQKHIEKAHGQKKIKMTPNCHAESSNIIDHQQARFGSTLVMFHHWLNPCRFGVFLLIRLYIVGLFCYKAPRVGGFDTTTSTSLCLCNLLWNLPIQTPVVAYSILKLQHFV